MSWTSTEYYFVSEITIQQTNRDPKTSNVKKDKFHLKRAARGAGEVRYTLHY